MSAAKRPETLFEAIVRRGNRPPLNRSGMKDERFADIRERPNWVTCVDGFTFSVIAGDGTYCTPRPSGFGNLADVPADYTGPYRAVELGYPSARPEPWPCPHQRTDYGHCNAGHPLGWQCLSEAGQHADDHDGVYGYVPVGMVRDLIAAHGGEQKVGNGDARPDRLDDLGDADVLAEIGGGA